MSQIQKTSSASQFNPRTVMTVIAISLMSFGALLALLAWGPELQNKNRAGAHAFSSSALGYAGLVKLLQYQEKTVTISRLERGINDHSGLVILAPGYTSTKLADQLPLYGPMLIILPKWNGSPDPRKPQWQEKTSLGGGTAASRILEYFDENAEARLVSSPSYLSVGRTSFSPVFDDKLQIIKSKELEIVIQSPGGALLAKMPDESVYFLSDPDLANNFGLASPENARLMMSILNTIDPGEETIVFDATLNGFERSTNLLRIVLDIPFLGATLTILSGFLLLGWAAFVRFGVPEKDLPAFALGKQALADNTAGLITMTHREARMAPGYLALSRKALIKSLGLPPGTSEQEVDKILERLWPASDDQKSWSQVADGLRSPTRSREDLLNKARQLYRWRKEKTNGN